jgi:LPXTG-site transpeptidase (sortase) family protein
VATRNTSTTTGRGRHSLWLAAVGVLLLVGGLVAWFTQAPHPAGTAAGPARAQEAVASSSTPVREAVPARPRPGAPHRIVIPRLSVDAPVLPIRAPGGTLVPPSDPQELGWWAAGARPGDRRGSALVTGHTVHTGGGALDDLETLARGDAVRVRIAHGWIRYAVRDVRIYDKGSVAQDASRLFSQRVPGRLVLVTCEDWDGVRYLSNVVVTAVPLTRRPE